MKSLQQKGAEQSRANTLDLKAYAAETSKVYAEETSSHTQKRGIRRRDLLAYAEERSLLRMPQGIRRRDLLAYAEETSSHTQKRGLFCVCLEVYAEEISRHTQKRPPSGARGHRLC